MFASPLRLNLQILCKHGTPVRKNLDSWPAFPIVIYYAHGYPRLTISPKDEDNIIAALEHPDRVCDVVVDATSSQLEKMAKLMREPFPVLRYLSICSQDGNVLDLPSKFLGRSAPKLQYICLSSMAYPALPKLLLSASDLVELKLHKIPQTGYISPKKMVRCLATLTRLKFLSIAFQSPPSRPNRIPVVTRSKRRAVLPALTSLFFWGVREYLEDFAARINAPRLDSIDIRYLNQLDFQVPQISKFIDRSKNLKRSLSRRCRVVIGPNGISFSVGIAIKDRAGCWEESTCFRIYIQCQGIARQVSHITQALSHISAMTSNMSHFAINQWVEPHCQLESMDDIEWLQLLRLFTSVQTLFVSGKPAGYIACALEDVTGEMATEVLPAVDLLCLEDQPVASVDKFIAIRRDSGRPVTIVNKKTEFGERFKSYQ